MGRPSIVAVGVVVATADVVTGVDSAVDVVVAEDTVVEVFLIFSVMIYNLIHLLSEFCSLFHILP